MDGRLGVTVVLFIWWNGMCTELGGEIREGPIVGVSTNEGPDAITVKSAGGILGWMDGRLGVTVGLFMWWNGMCIELGGEI